MEEKSITHGLWAATAPEPPILNSIEGQSHTDDIGENHFSTAD